MKRFLLFLTMLLCACSESPQEPQQGSELPDGAVFSENFVMAYMFPDEFKITTPGGRYIGIELYSDSICSQNVKADVYDELCQKHNDVSYNRKNLPGSNPALGVEYTAINVVSDKDIDAEHKAGALLNDMIKICAVSYQDYIASGYDPSFRSEFPAEFSTLFRDGQQGRSPVFKLLSELEKDDLQLIEPILYLYLTENFPAGKYTFTITIISGEGELTGKQVVTVS